MDGKEAEILLERLQLAVVRLVKAADRPNRGTKSAEAELLVVARKLYQGLTGEAPDPETISRIVRW